MPRTLILSSVATLALLLGGCIASMTVVGVDGGTGDDDDSADDDDDATGDDDDATGDDDDTPPDDDDDVVPQVECGPLEFPDGPESGGIYSGAGVVSPNADGSWGYDGCEVLRLFEDGDLVCESHWRAFGPMIAWNDGQQAGAFRLDFIPVPGDTACGDEVEAQWRYRISFGWETSTALVEWATGGGGAPDWSFWAEGVLPVIQEGYIEVEYATPFFEEQ